MDHATSIETLTTSLTVTYSGESNPPPLPRPCDSRAAYYLIICTFALKGGGGGTWSAGEARCGPSTQADSDSAASYL